MKVSLKTKQFKSAQVNQDAIDQYDYPEILNTDQGSQFTRPVLTKISVDNDIEISMDGKGSALDSLYIERFWRALKYEQIYLNPANGGVELSEGVKKYIDYTTTEEDTHASKIKLRIIFIIR